MNHATPNRSFYTAVAVLLVLCFLPAGFTTWLSGRVGELAIPLSAPLSKLSLTIRAMPKKMDPKDPEFERLATAYKQANVRIYELELRAADLQRQLERLQELRAIDPSFRYVSASRVAESLGSSDLYKINVGSLIGVRVGSMALYEGYQLLGRVSAVSPRSATITPITSTSFGPISALVISQDQSLEKATACTLEPVGDGTFRGELGEEAPVKPGLRVVYRDPDPRHLNSGPFIGVIESVTPKDDAPLWNTIIVRPEVNIQDVSVVDLKIPRSDASSGGDN